MSLTEMPCCRNVSCKYHSDGDVSCRLRTIQIDANGKCVYSEEKEPKINIESSVSVDPNRKYIRDKLVPEVIAELEKISKIRYLKGMVMGK